MTANNMINIPTPFPLSKGGTGANLTASNGGIVYSTASTLAILAGTATAGQILRSGASSAPSWSTSTFPGTAGTAGNVLISNGTNYISSTSLWPNTVGSVGKILRSDGTTNAYTTATFADTYAVSTLLYAGSSNVVSGLATANSAGLVTNGSGVPAWQTLTAGQILIGTTAGAPAAAAINSGSGILVANGSGSITVNLAAIADHTLLANISGGALAPSSTTLTALIDNAIGSVQGDILYRNATVWTVLAPGTSGQLLKTGGAAADPSWTTATFPATAGATGTILRSDGTNWIASTSTFADTYAASTLLYSNGANTVTGLATANSGVLITSAGGVPSWKTGTFSILGIGGGAADWFTPTVNGSIAQGFLALSPAFTPYSMPSTTLTANGLLFASTTTAVTQLAVGSAGQILQSAGAASPPAWTTATFPATGGASGNILISNGTNYIASTSLWPNTVGTARKIIVSDGTSNVYSTETWAVPGTSGNVLTSNGTNWTSAAPATAGTVTSVATSGLATGGTITSTGTITVTAASASDQNTSTSTTTVVTPAQQYSNPSAFKAWAVCSNNGSTITIQDSFNVTSCTRNTTGVIDVVISKTMANTTYAVFMQHGANSNGFMRVSVTSDTTFTITTSTILGAAEDTGFWFGVVGHSTA